MKRAQWRVFEPLFDAAAEFVLKGYASCLFVGGEGGQERCDGASHVFFK